jgi:hypothetical protein
MKTASLLVERLWEALGSFDPKVLNSFPTIEQKRKVIVLVAKGAPFKNFGESSKKSDKLKR